VAIVAAIRLTSMQINNKSPIPDLVFANKEAIEKNQTVAWKLALDLKKTKSDFNVHSLIPHYKWSTSQIIKDSPSALPADKIDQNLALLNLYDDDVRLGMIEGGNLTVNTVACWKKNIKNGPLSPSPRAILPQLDLMINDGGSRSHYVVVHLSSILSFEGTLIKWMIEALPLVLKAIVKTSNGSFQAWFDLHPKKVPILHSWLKHVFKDNVPIVDCRNVVDMPSADAALIYLADQPINGGGQS
jgi:hypothetical protein